MTTLGVELEMAVGRLDDGSSHPVGPYFHTLRRLKQARGESARLIEHHGQPVAVHAPLVVSAVDNAYNNLESAIGVIEAEDPADPSSGLHRLDALMRRELTIVDAALAEEGAFILNASQHPDVKISDTYYRSVRAPKPIYDYWVRDRGWAHSVGVDAKAQNGPTTGVPADNAVRALNLILAAAPAFIALTANSPLEAGRLTGIKETRLTMWPRMFANARCAADLTLQRLPDRPFRDLRDYFSWMFGHDTCMQAVPVDVSTHDYKSQDTITIVEGNPSLLTFLNQRAWSGRRLDTAETVRITPCLGHLTYLQFSHFLDARIRFGFNETASLEHFHTAWERDGGLEEMFTSHAAYCYIEGRSPGANFADADLWDSAGDTVAASVTIAPSALQRGLLRNIDAAWNALRGIDWQTISALRQAAIQDGLHGSADGMTVRTFCDRVMSLARDGLDADEHWMLAYPEHVLGTMRNGADRTLSQIEQLGLSPAGIGKLCLRRRALCPPAPYTRADTPSLLTATAGGTQCP